MIFLCSGKTEETPWFTKIPCWQVREELKNLHITAR
jgi:hypothetical protein